MKHLSIKMLEEDKLELEKQLQLASGKVGEMQAQILRLEGALIYVNTSIGRMVEDRPKV